jgi:Phosphotransferase enzyme family
MGAAERLPEPERNELLRRVDWRFLLGQESEPRTVCFASGRLARAVELISAPATQGGQAPRPADLAVLVNPGRAALRAACAALGPGGELYAEWYLPRVGGPARVRKRLEATGFSNVRCWWPWPWPDRAAPQFWLPVDAPTAIAFFLRSRPLAPRRWRRGALTALWRCAARLGVLTPLCTVARKPGGDRREGEEGLHWLLLTGGRRSINKVVGLVFADSAPEPQLAVKFARSESEEEPLRREATVLQLLADTRPELRGVPRVEFLEHRSGRLALGETAVRGVPLLGRLNQDTFAQLAAQVTDWLAELAGAAQAQPRSAWWQRLVDEPLQAFEQTFAGIIGARDATRARDIFSSLGDLPLVCEHRDCSPWNVLVDDSSDLAVVDWESAEPSGLPALDLIYFLTYAAFFVDGALASGRTRESYAATLDAATFTGAIVARCERRYCELVGLEPELLRPLRLLCWLVHSRSDYRHLELEAAAPPDRDALRGAFFLGLWQDELQRS